MNPVYLVPACPVTELIVYETHLNLNHGGVTLTLGQLRINYWLPQGRRRIKIIIKKKCIICRKLATQPFQWPTYPQLPLNRVTRSRPFEHIGVDYFGPLKVKNNNTISKVWVPLYTCLAIRAIHLDLVTDLSAEAFLDSLKRFIALRAKPLQANMGLISN